eukprot:scaffold3.g6531.t1
MARVVAFRACPAPTAARITVPRRVTVAPLTIRQQRPVSLRSEFVSPVATLKGLCASFASAVLGAARGVLSAGARLPLLVECNVKKGLGCTLHGTRRKRARVSGFRARNASTGGRKVLAARRKKGRKALCPAAVPKRKS